MFAPVVAGAGVPVGVDGGDEEVGVPVFDELPADERAGSLRDQTVCWVAERWARRADQLELT